MGLGQEQVFVTVTVLGSDAVKIHVIFESVSGCELRQGLFCWSFAFCSIPVEGEAFSRLACDVDISAGCRVLSLPPSLSLSPSLSPSLSLSLSLSADP